jgi:hypothetical protein
MLRLCLPLFLLACRLAAIPSPEQWVPLRWPSADSATLALLDGTALNCLLIPEEKLSAEFARAAHAKNLVVLATLTPGSGVAPRAKKALDLGLDGIVLDGAFSEPERKALNDLGKPVIYLGLRGEIPLDENAPAIIGTFQGVWAGINPHEEGSAKAAPSGAPWIDTNAGFLRFVRASTNRSFWLSATPPANSVITVQRYVQMICDAAMVSARWVITFELAFYEKLFAGEAKSIREFQRMARVVAFLEENRALSQLPSYGQLAVIEDVQNGALLSGSVLDMITVKHTPVRPVRSKQIKPELFADAKMAVNVDPQSLAAEQLQILRGFTRAGGTVLTAPAGWRMPEPKADQVTLDAKDVEKLDQIWKEVNSMTGRRNLGARLFNVSSMLSNMTATTDGSKVVLYLVNYADYPVDTIAVHLLGKFKKATVYWPERKPKQVELYENEDGVGADVDILDSTAILIAEK